MKTRILSLLLVIFSAGLLTACADSNGHWSDAETRKRSTVEMVRLSHPLYFAEGSTELSAAQKQSLQTFFRDINVGYGDSLSMDVPLDHAGHVSDIDQKRHASIAEYLKKRGLMLSAEFTPYGIALAPGNARLVVSRYTVELPKCPDWRQDSSPNYANATTSNFGCAHATNLGLMVANPKDLVVGQTYDGPHAAVAAKAVNKYMSGGKKKSSSTFSI